jgi:hypothetical protein
MATFGVSRRMGIRWMPWQAGRQRFCQRLTISRLLLARPHAKFCGCQLLYDVFQRFVIGPGTLSTRAGLPQRETARIYR